MLLNIKLKYFENFKSIISSLKFTTYFENCVENNNIGYG